VTATMVITTILACVVMVKVWNWNKFLVALIIGVFMAVDLGFFGANLLKVEEGGWLPLGIGALLFFLLMTWFKGRMIVKERTAATVFRLCRSCRACSRIRRIACRVRRSI
jgi:K+ transporter